LTERFAYAMTHERRVCVPPDVLAVATERVLVFRSFASASLAFTPPSYARWSLAQLS
jgi:hypothetical protein